jgi:microcompartment protein CcmL/EutN
MLIDTLGLIEWQSIAMGIGATDKLLKAAEIKLIDSRCTCPGRYYTLITGDTASVQAAIQKAREYSIEHVIDSVVIPGAHPHLLEALVGRGRPEKNKAVGIVETFTLASCLLCADTLAKTALIDLLEVRLGIGLAGKSIAICTGEVAAVESAVNRCPLVLKDSSNLVATEVIPAPHGDLPLLF